MSGVEFPSVPAPSYPGGCTLEPGPYALDHLVRWRADVKLGERVVRNAPVLALLREVSADPAGHGVTPDEADEAVARFLAQGGQVLEREGGDAAWLAREFTPRGR